ncbi:tyrosine-protein phosphatase [Yinghuangia seranimata]|uniref:tyrosine-protein phosphatase n=1 Tax=Yinghuangia seranimata TaxID=408067 RepID=UPI00248AEFA1|nr:tyrosine-protein phosphatase [Yinghuangia seranimata]MDI2132762.1 tyrosine-protein phosphatase [Yinghuangia seranimata]
MGQHHADPEGGTVVLEGVRNFRDIGGLPTIDGGRIRPGRYFRSGHLAKPTDADRAALAALGIRLVVDLRSPADIELDGEDALPGGARWLNLPMTDPARHADFWADIRSGDMTVLRERLGDGKAEAAIARDYRDQVVTRRANHTALLNALVDDGLPAVVHCSAGKDRAGIAAALVQRIAGVPDDAIMANYLESNDPGRRYSPNTDKLADRPELAALFAPFLEVRAEYLAGALETMDTHWGGFAAYLEEGLGFGPDRQKRLRELLVD